MQKAKKTKIVATLGPVSANFDMIKDLVLAGVNVLRLNFSHGSHEVHQNTINDIVRFRKEFNLRPSILADLQGPKIRLGVNEDANGNDGIAVDKDEEVYFTTDASQADPLNKVFLIKLDSFAQDVKLSDRIIIDDGKMQFKVLESNGEDKVKLKALNGGLVKSKKGVNLPDTDISVPALTEKDLKDLDYILTQPVDWIALSFVRSAKDILDLRQRIEAKGRSIKIVAKIEKPEAVKNFDDIVKVTDAVMVARGDLGVEIPFEKVPLVQKEIVRKCIEHARPVIIATQVMESMIENPTPTRAEITDVSNVVLEGADAVMLSGETSVGKYPVKVIETISKTVRELEKSKFIYNKNLFPSKESDTFLADAVCYNAAKLSQDLQADAIGALTKSGFTAQMISSYRPQAPIYAFTDNEEVMCRLSLLWGVETYFFDGTKVTDDALEEVNGILKEKKHLKKGDLVINTASMPVHHTGNTNMIKVSEIVE